MASLGTPLDEMSEHELLDAAGACVDALWRAEVDLLLIAEQWAVLHAPERLDPHESAKPGRESVKQLGGPGTPEVTEFAASGLAARIGRSPYAAAQLIGDALDLTNRLPQLWARVQAGEVRSSYARHVARATRDLEPAEAAYVAAAVVESADGRLPWSRFETLVAAKVAQAAPERAREQEIRRAQATFARKTANEGNGMASFLVRADVATIEAIDGAVAHRAGQLAALQPDLSADHRRVLAALQLATGAAPDADLGDSLPQVQLFVHVYDGPEREVVARVEGHGPVTDAWVRKFLGPRARFKVQPVLDLAGQAPVDAYEIPDRHRQAVHLMTPADTFPHAACTSRAMQVDHTIPYDAGGESGIGNYGPMTTTHHRIKTHGRWQVRQPFPGIYLWRDPHGAFYVVDHTGTRRLPSDPSVPATRMTVVELWEETAIQVRYEPAA